MATLEKIRSKSVFLIIVIGVALLAFIVGDAISNGRNLFGKGNRLAKVGDSKIEISEYQQREQQLSDLYKDQGVDQSEIATVALQQLMDEKLLDAAVEQMDIDIDDKSLAFYIFDMPLPPVQMFIMQNLGQQVTPAMASDMINNPNKYSLQPQQAEALKEGWIQMELRTKNAVKRHIYEQLIAGAVRPNTLERKDMQARATESLNVNLAAKPFDKATLDKYKVSDAEINSLYNERKEYYRVYEPTATIGFVYGRVAPSQVDIVAAQKASLAAATAMKNSQPISAALQKQGIRTDKNALPTKYISSQYLRFPYNADQIASAPLDSVMSFVNANFYMNVKKTAQYVANDSVEIAVFEVPKADMANLTSILNTGLKADSVAARTANKAKYIGTDVILAQNPQYRSSIPVDIMSQLDTVAAGKVITLTEGDAKNPYRLARIEKAVSVEVYQFEAANYELLPSTETLAEAREKMENFGSKNKTLAAFKKNAAAAGYQYMPFTVSASTPNIPAPDQTYGFRSFPNSSAAVQWAMGDVTSGEISDVFDNKDARDPWLYIAILADQADEYIPASDPVVKDELTNMIKRRKAGDAMVKQYSGKGNLNATAQAMGVVPANVADMRFGGAAMLRDLVVSARIMGTAPGSKVHVAKGDNGVYAYEVVSKNANNTPADKAQQNMIYNAIFGGFDNPNPQNPLPYGAIGKLLRGNMQIENNRYELMGSN